MFKELKNMTKTKLANAHESTTFYYTSHLSLAGSANEVEESEESRTLISPASPYS